MQRASSAWLFVGLATLSLTACGGGGGGGATGAIPPIGGQSNAASGPPQNGFASPSNPITAATPEAIMPPSSPAPAGAPLSVASLGGYQGNTYVAHHSGDSYEYSEDVAVTFNKPLNTSAFTYTITPSTPSSVYFWNYGRTPAITFRKTPGVVYTITIPVGTPAADGTILNAPYSFTISTPANPQIPAPIRSTRGEPYRYGVLEHPFPFSLSGPTAQQQINLLAQAGVRFVRIDYCGSQIEPNQGQFDFSTLDSIMDQLVAKGITELPIVEQYCAPTWATGGHGYPAIWQQPSDYAAFAGAIAAHVAQKYPTITRMELFNEPNLGGWWTNPNPQYAARDGSATAVYMRAAYAAIKQAMPSMTVVGPALSDGGGMVTDPRKFLQTLYNSGCRVGVCWDVLSVHNYRWYNPTFYTSSSYMNQWGIYQQLQQIAVQNGDPMPHVMLTEWGFSNDPTSPVGFDPAVQARYVALGFNLMLSDPTVDGIVYVNLYNPGTDFWGRTSLTDTSFGLLPGFSVYQQFATF